MTHDEFLSRLASEYPQTAKSNDLRALVIPSLIAPAVLNLPKAWMNEAKSLVSLFHSKIRESSKQGEKLSALHPAIPKPANGSVLMSYDFHVDYRGSETGRLKLIEINTNASMSLLVDTLAVHQRVGHEMRESFLDDFAEDLGRPLNGARVVIVDDAPEKQKLYVEFLMYKELFESRGAIVHIRDRRDLEFHDGRLWAKSIDDSGAFGPVDLVYNRLTDFYFEEAESVPLFKAMHAQSCTITPHPFDYRMLADKNRLIEWCVPGALESYGLDKNECEQIRSCLLETRDTAGLDPEEIWKERKHLIIKPKTSHGGKGVYRGSSISRTPFQTALAKGALIQEFVPAPVIELNGVEFKYDLRFFAYRDRVTAACARLYQGQTTNATTPGGGVAALTWS